MTQRLVSVRQRLAEYGAPADARERAYVDAAIRLTSGSPPEDPFSRSSFHPGHLTASAFVMAPDGESVLLIFHGKLQRWLQPGGHFDPEDLDLESAARREVAEETGVTELTTVGSGLFDVDLHEIPPLRGEPSHFHFDLRVLFRADSWDLRAGSDAREARWARLDAVDEQTSDASVVRAVSKLRRSQRSGLRG